MPAVVRDAGPLTERDRRPSNALAARYGRKQGWCRHHLYRWVRRWGGLRHFEDIDWGRVTRLVFVCKGNICRSAYAAARARALGLPAASFGLEVNGSPQPNETAVRIARQRGVELEGHRPRPIGVCSPDPGDVFLGMEPWQGKLLLPLCRASGAQVTLLGLWCRDSRPHIQDPYGLSDEYFHTCFALIEEAIEQMVSRLVSTHAF